jgi:tetratricopeptide (TPR) repeat protein
MLPAAVLGALFFAIHPLRVESVAWVTERRDVLSGFFLLLSVLAYLRREEAAPARRARLYGVSLACFTLSLLSKAVGMTLPLVLVVLDAYPLRRFRPGAARRVLLEKIPYVTAALAVAVAAVAAQKSAGAMVVDFGDYSVTQRAAQAGFGLLFYVAKTLWPAGLSPIYPLNKGFDPFGAVFIVSGLAVVIITIGLVACGRRAPWAIAAWAAYGIAVMPVLGWAQSGPQIAADRYMYIASMPWSVLLAAGLLRAGNAGVLGRLVTRSAAVAALAVLGILSFNQSRIWRDSFTLFDRALKVNPVNPLALLGRGVAWQDHGEALRAIDDFSACLRLDPDDAGAYRNRAVSRQSVGDLDGAIADYSEAIRVSPEDAKAYAGRGRARRDRGDPAGALADLDEAIRLDPRQAQAYANRGLLRLDGGLGNEAGADFDRALGLDPGNAEAYEGRALVKRMRGDLDGALSDLDMAVSAEPTHARVYSNRGIVRLERGYREGALQDFEAAVRLGPNVASAYANRGFARLELQDARGALADFDRSLSLAPGNPESRIGRARALAATGDAQAAVAELESLLGEQAPTWPGRALAEGELAAVRAREAR